MVLSWLFVDVIVTFGMPLILREGVVIKADKHFIVFYSMFDSIISQVFKIKLLFYVIFFGLIQKRFIDIPVRCNFRKVIESHTINQPLWTFTSSLIIIISIFLKNGKFLIHSITINDLYFDQIINS